MDSTQITALTAALTAFLVSLCQVATMYLVRKTHSKATEAADRAKRIEGLLNGKVLPP